jgi:hypothetical protein
MSEERRQIPRRIGLIGCVKEKAADVLPAKDLYISALFRGRRSFVERSCDSWWILSAEHGLVHPDEVLAPYDTAMGQLGVGARRTGSERVMQSLGAQVQPSAGDIIELHAGREYRESGLCQALQARGCTIEVPTLGLGIGKQLRFYRLGREAAG